MENTATGKNKWVLIIFRIVTILLCLLCIFCRLMINYSLLYSYGLSLENSLRYSVLAVVFFVAFCLSFIKAIKKKAVVFTIITIVFVVIASFISMKIPNVYQYESNKKNDDVSAYFLFDDLIDEKSSKNYYYLKKVHLFDACWIGCNLKKDFETTDSFEDMMLDPNDRYVLISYYYLKDPSGRRIKEYTKKKEFSDAFDISLVYDNEIHTDEYSAYEYENQLEFISKDDDMVFYISGNKNKYTNYDLEKFVDYAIHLLEQLEKDEQP